MQQSYLASIGSHGPFRTNTRAQRIVMELDAAGVAWQVSSFVSRVDVVATQPAVVGINL